MSNNLLFTAISFCKLTSPVLGYSSTLYKTFNTFTKRLTYRPPYMLGGYSHSQPPYGWLWVLLVKSLAVRLTLCSFTVSLYHAIMLCTWSWCWANKDDDDDDVKMCTFGFNTLPARTVVVELRPERLC